MSVRNPSLYAALKRVFGDVRVSREGEPLQIEVVRGGGALEVKRHPGTLRRYRTVTHDGGEYYSVNCPECGDKRRRLWINHMWDCEHNGVRLTNLAVCYNEGCQSKPGFYARLRDALKTGKSMLPNVARPAEVVEERAVEWPGKCIRFDAMPDDHPAVAYMTGRGYDKNVLGKTWGVSWCEYSAVLPTTNRIVFPIYDYMDGELRLVGTQSRFFDMVAMSGSTSSKRQVKWFTQSGSKVKRHLYNGYRTMRQHDFIVVCEGPLDVIRLGPNYAVGLFGKSISTEQAALLYRNWGAHGATLVIALDPDAYTDADSNKHKKSSVDVMKEKLTGWSKIVELRLPDGQDVGATPEHELASRLTAVIGDCNDR